jgi:hypothetical protein
VDIKQQKGVGGKCKWMAKTYWTAGRRDPVSLTNLREFQWNYFLCRNLFCFLFSKIGAKTCRLSLRGLNFYVVIDRSIESHTLKEELEIFWWLRGGRVQCPTSSTAWFFVFGPAGTTPEFTISRPRRLVL